MNMRNCFFCGLEISGKTSREHIFGDSFLAYLGLKRDKLSSSQLHPTAYSKVKVPAHAGCNNQQGSWLEDYILKLVKTMDQNLDRLADLHLSSGNKLNEALRQAFTQWLAKIYFGLIYWEAGLKNHVEPAYQRSLVELLSGAEFAYLRRCFVDDLGFRLPSSIFHFRVPDPPDSVFRFDFGTELPHGLIYIHFQNHLLVGALGDGMLVHEWFTNEHVKQCQSLIDEQSQADPVAYLHAVAHIWAVREWLPVQPNIDFYDWGIRDRSRDDFVQRPAIDGEAVNSRAREIFEEQASKWRNDP